MNANLFISVQQDMGKKLCKMVTLRQIQGDLIVNVRGVYIRIYIYIYVHVP